MPNAPSYYVQPLLYLYRSKYKKDLKNLGYSLLIQKRLLCTMSAKSLCPTMATIKFMRLSKIRKTFFFPEVDDIASVLLDDIKTKLPVPKTCNKIKRGSSKYTFDSPLWVIPNLR